MDVHVPGYPQRDRPPEELTTIAARLLRIHPVDHGMHCLTCGGVRECDEHRWARGWLATDHSVQAPTQGRCRGARDGRGGRRYQGAYPGAGRRVPDLDPVLSALPLLALMRGGQL